MLLNALPILTFMGRQATKLVCLNATHCSIFGQRTTQECVYSIALQAHSQTTPHKDVFKFATML